ncbi:NAC domain-containing protein 90-like [Benincasa hispida]|uniref:NAC domain-containing protein 90-like n=1 Tax=Benincasa hispida TaxID=102211 RepID=UPI0018FF35F5|nr:NAC domain-containing protein 90-like [Benincasa hispida]
MGDYNLPPGFRFYPTEEELVSFYLYHKLEGGREAFNGVVDQIIPVLDIYHFNPWDLPQFAGEVCKRDEEQWFFFIPRQESEARGGRPKRVTTTGYWKATGSPSYVYSSNNHKSIGVKRSMVFYNGRAPKGTKTQWKMNEYKLIGHHFPSTTTFPNNKLSLCRIYKKSKTVRAFDRRPPLQQMEASIPAELRPTTSQHNDICDQFVDDQKLPNPSLMAAERPSSSESFSSGDHNGESANNNLKMEVDNNELVWDWNHLNWL